MSTLESGQNVNVGKKTLVIEKKLGSGAFGTVYKVSDVKSGETFALKTQDFSSWGKDNFRLILQEVLALLAVKHKHIVQIVLIDTHRISLWKFWNKLFLILTEYCSGGDLNSRLDRESTNDKNMKWIFQLSEALSYLHSLNPAIVHRDLKTDNVLITNASDEDIKLCDFGLARQYVGYDGQSMETYYMNTCCGTPHWMPPEFFLGGSPRYTDKADVFSLGGIFYAILERSFKRFGTKKMFGVFTNTAQGKLGLGQAMACVDRNAKVTFTTSFRGSNSMKHLIEDMLEFDPHNRPSANEVYKRLLTIISSLNIGRKVYVQSKTLVNEEELGSGAFGTVYKVRDVNSGDTCALKTVNFTSSDEKETLHEAEKLQVAKHKHIVQIMGVDTLQLTEWNKLFLVLIEYCSGGSLNNRLNRESTNDKNMKWILQLSQALDYLHFLDPPILHRNLKADNVLITNAEDEDLKLGDFGLAREYVKLKNVGYDGKSMETYYMTSGCGPIHWVAPEFFSQQYTDKADVFSLGGIFYAILERSFERFGSKKMYGVFIHTFWGRIMGLGSAMACFNLNTRGVRFTPSFRGSNSMKRVIQDMLEFDPHNRPSANEVYERLVNINSSIKVGSVGQQSSANNANNSCW